MKGANTAPKPPEAGVATATGAGRRFPWILFACGSIAIATAVIAGWFLAEDVWFPGSPNDTLRLLVGFAVALALIVALAATLAVQRLRGVKAAEDAALAIATQAEQELDRSRRRQLELKDQFLSHVSHELRSPLAAIYGFVTMVRDGLAGDITDQQREYLSVAVRSIGQLESMIGDLLDATRAETGKLGVDPGRTTLHEIAEEAFETVEAKAAAKEIELRSEVPEGLPPVMADARRVRQVLINLLDNAIKFTHHGGSVRLEASLDTEPRMVTVSVVDDGPGIEDEAAGRVFDRLYQESEAADTGRAGLGLGLYICKELVERQGGRIWVETGSGTGSAFRFTLPTFSLADLMAPVAVEAGRMRRSFALLTFTLKAETPASRKLQVRVLRRAREVLGASVIPDRDVLLPPFGPASEERAVHVVASSDRLGAERMSGRLLERMEREPDLKGISFDVDVAPIELRAADPEGGVEELVACIEELVHRQPVRAGAGSLGI